MILGIHILRNPELEENTGGWRMANGDVRILHGNNVFNEDSASASKSW
jgi:hypothetical protein